ncbi:hypothetical protein ACOMHN_054819 [Nucella lapillus]
MAAPQSVVLCEVEPHPVSSRPSMPHGSNTPGGLLLSLICQHTVVDGLLGQYIFQSITRNVRVQCFHDEDQLKTEGQFKTRQQTTVGNTSPNLD